jgi:Ion channel
MLPIIVHAGFLVAVTVAVHAGGLAVVLGHFSRPLQSQVPTRFWPTTWLLVRATWLLILIHLAEIAVWAWFYWWKDCLPDAESALYFSGVTYATVGYGDLVLKEPWRLLAPVEGLVGILMCGLSAGFYFALVSRIFASRLQGKPG